MPGISFVGFFCTPTPSQQLTGSDRHSTGDGSVSGGLYLGCGESEFQRSWTYLPIALCNAVVKI